MGLCSVWKKDLLIADEVRIASSFLQKLLGLLPAKSLGKGQGLLLQGCRQVHTIGMSFPIDVIFLTKNGEIISIENTMLPSKISKTIKCAYWTLELCAGIASKKHLTVHDQLIFNWK